MSKNADPAEIMIACIEVFLDKVGILIDDESCTVVVIASGGLSTLLLHMRGDRDREPSIKLQTQVENSIFPTQVQI